MVVPIDVGSQSSAAWRQRPFQATTCKLHSKYKVKCFHKVAPFTGVKTAAAARWNRQKAFWAHQVWRGRHHHRRGTCLGAAGALDLTEWSEQELAAQAEEWGYSKLGKPLPEGVSRDALAGTLPSEIFDVNPKLAWGRSLLPAGLMALGYTYLWYMHGIAPLVGKVLSWLAIGTGYFGLFVAATDCAHFSFTPQQPFLQVKTACVFSAVMTYNKRASALVKGV